MTLSSSAQIPSDTVMRAAGFRAGFRRSVAANPEAVALVDARDGRQFTYAELFILIRKAASVLRMRAGGGPMVMALPNSVDTLVVFLAALEGGVDVSPLPPQASALEASRMISVVKPTSAVTAADMPVPLLEVLSAHCDLLSITPDGQFNWCRDNAPTEVVDRVARLFMSTSGSTGEPKAMVIDSDRLWDSGIAFIREFPFADASSRFYNFLPMHYMAGLYNLGMIPLSLGASVVVGEALSARSLLSFWRDVDHFGVTVLWLVPTIVRGLLQLGRRGATSGDPEPWRRVVASFLGTAPIELSTKQEFEATFGFPLLENYALSETLFLTSERLNETAERRMSSVGRPLPFVQIRLQADVPGMPGRILVRTPYLMLGYMDAAGMISLPDEDGWFPTGDLGTIDESGVLALAGRTRDVIKKGGLMISLREVECIAETHREVREAIAVGIPHKSYGEDYVLYIDGSIEAEAFQTWLMTQISAQKQPCHVENKTEFPRTASGKVRKHLLASDWLSREGKGKFAQ